MEGGGRGGGAERGGGRREGLKGGGGMRLIRFVCHVTRDMKWKAEMQQSPSDRGRFGHTGVYMHTHSHTYICIHILFVLLLFVCCWVFSICIVQCN